MMEPNLEKLDQTAFEIVKGASELFMKYGLRSVTMDDLARHLSISKKTIYQHFADKDELVNTFTQIVLNEQKSECLSIEEANENVLMSLHKLSEFMRSKVCNINPGVLFDLKKYFPKAWKVFVDYKRGFLKDHLVRLLTKGIEQGYFRKDINVEILCRMRMEQVEMSFNNDVFPQSELDIAEVHIQLFYHFVFGICTLKGHEEFYKIFQISE
jgi:TetR/AcrR family transcriptional regulator, cholesterol catabolism regulator